MFALNYFSRLTVLIEFLKLYGLNKAIKGIFFYNYRILKRKFSNQRIEQVHVNGYKLNIIPNDVGISEELRMFKTHEPITTQLISQEIKSGMICLEIGANIGYYSILESKLVGKDGQVIAIEPSPENYKRLLQNIRLNKISNIETFNFACGNMDGTIQFLVSEKSNRCTTIDKNNVIPEKGEIINVPVKKLDTFLKEKNIDKIDFVRMDVEGYESTILSGCNYLFEKFSPMIQIEIHKKFMPKAKTKEILLNFHSMNYECKYYIPRDLDMPIIGSISDAKYLSIEKLEEMMRKNKLPGVFCLFLVKNDLL